MSLSKPTEAAMEREVCVSYLDLNNDRENNNRSRPDPVTSCFITDPIHGEIEVPVVCQAFLHSLEFDRLRSIKQLGCSHYVFPGAKHCRLEHSLGVMHLAGQFLQHLMLKRPGCASKEDRLCVMLAGLLHDLGHGPFSHLWEWFVREARPEAKWNHEATSLQLLDNMVQEYNLLPILEEHGLTAKDVIFIKELICGPLQKKDSEWPYEGRGPEKYFLYEFIANKISSVDVDKWDYMLRDAAAMESHGKILFNYKKFINNSDITELEGKMRLCLRDKQKENLGYLFQDRARLHKNYYQENTVKVVDRMMMDAFLLADPYLNILGSKDDAARFIRISEACDNIETFLKLSDDFLLRSIQFSSQSDLEPARALVRRIASRNFYKLLGEVPISGTTMDAQTCKRQIDNMLKEDRNASIKNEDIIVCGKKIGSLGDQNMQEKVIFVDKDNFLLQRPVAEVMKAAPCFETLLVICKRDQMDTLAIEEAKDIFKEWSEKYNAELAKKATKET